MTGVERWEGWQVHDEAGRRKYLSGAERARFLAAADRLAPQMQALCYVLAYAGCRVSEALGLTVHQVDAERLALTIRTLKRRRVVFRIVAGATGRDRQAAYAAARCGRPVLADAPRHRLADRKGDDASRRHRRPDGLPQGAAARLRRACRRTQRSAEPHSALDGACLPRDDGDLCRCSRRRRTAVRQPNVVMGPGRGRGPFRRGR